MKGGQIPDGQDLIIQTLINDISNAKKINNIAKFNEIMKALNQSAKTVQLSIVQRFPIFFYSFYNHITPKSQNSDIKKLKELSIYMVNNLQNKNILPFFQMEIDKNFSNDFKNYKIFDNKEKNKDACEICFSICLLSKNIKLIEIFFSEYLNVTIFEGNNFNSIDLENPIASKLFDSIFNNIYSLIKNNKRENIKATIEECLKDSNISLNKLFRCNKCYDIMMMKYDSKNIFKVKCLNCDKKYKEYKNDEFKTDFSCVECGKNIILYERNYKYTRCKKLLCSKCINNHCNICFSLRFIKLHEVGYKCEFHNGKYTYYCSICKKICVKFVKIYILI